MIRYFIVLSIFSLGLSAAELTVRENQLLDCLPLLATLQVMSGKDSKVPESPRIFASFVLDEMTLSSNPLFVHAALEIIKPGRIKDMVVGKFTHDDMSPDLATKIWNNFLKNFNPNETDQDALYKSWTDANAKIKKTGQIDFKAYKEWQELSREFVFNPHKSDAAIALIREMMPMYLVYLDYWFDRYEVAGQIRGPISWLFNVRSRDRLTGLTKQAEKKLRTDGPLQFEAKMGELDLLPTTLEQFKDAMARIVDLDKLVELKPEADLTDSKTASMYGTFFNPLVLAISDALMSVQQSHLRNLQMKNLKDQYPEGKLPARIDHIDIKGLNNEIERERAKIVETHTKVEYLFKIEAGIEKVLKAYLTLGHEIREGKFANERIQMAFLSRLDSLERFSALIAQVIATTGFVLDGLQVDRLYLDNLGLAVSQAHLSESMEKEKPEPSNTK